MYFDSPKLSLNDLVGEAYMRHVVQANTALGRMEAADAAALAAERVDFFPEEQQALNDELLGRVGASIVDPFENDMEGAPTNSFRKAAHRNLAPLTGAGCYRIGEDGASICWAKASIITPRWATSLRGTA